MAPHVALHRPTRTPARLSLGLSPLATALALAWQGAHAATPAPVATKVPVPAATWRVAGTGAAAPVNTANARGGTSQTIDQTSQRAIYNWQSFDIGASSDVTFNMALPGASALNRVTGSAEPSQILGQLKATNGGQLILINRNGVLFGAGAQVNAGALIASTLNISDSEFNSGFNQSIANANSPELRAAFQYDGAAADFVDSRNFVRVDQGATITTDSGGRVMLFAKRVENAGSISAPDGQVVLGAGGAVYFKLPSSEAGLYAAEANPQVQVLRGFLVEMGNGPKAAPEGATGSVVNALNGRISTPRGNTTLVGMAVNQMGRISATTSVSANGSILLKAQGAASFDDDKGRILSRSSGALLLGQGSQLSIQPDTETAQATTTNASTFLPSFVELAGKSVVMGPGASVVAPGGSVHVRAERVPSYEALSEASPTAGDSDARIVLGENTLIDVSGTTDTVRSVADLFVTTELLGSNDLKDAPLQKDGLLYRAKVTLDTRDDSLILGDLSAYRNNIARTVGEKLSAAGSVNLRAQGAVVTSDSSDIRLKGGLITYTAAQVSATQLVAADGRLYDLATAPTDLVYTSAFNLQKSSAIGYDRWGQKLQFGLRTARQEAGYTEGQAAGSLSVIAPTVQLRGQLQAGTTVGSRQASGLDAQASAGSLAIGAVTQGGEAVLSAADDRASAVLSNFSISASGPVVSDEVLAHPRFAELDAGSGISASLLSAAGFDQVTVVADQDVRFEQLSSQPWQLNAGGTLSLGSVLGNVVLSQSLRGAGARVELLSKPVAKSASNQVKTTGGVQVAEGVHVDLSGAWVNQYLDATPRSTAWTAGGSFKAEGLGVTLGQGSVVDVSGGGAVSVGGAVSAAKAGSITLSDQTAYPQTVAQTAPTLVLGGTLRGYSGASSSGVASGGGSLTLKTSRIVITDDATARRDDALNLGSDYFSQGGFGSFALDGRLGLDVTAGTVIAPQRSTWMSGTTTRFAANGQTAAQALQSGLAPGLLPGAVNLALAASGDSAATDLNQPNGVLTVARGAVLRPGDQGGVSLQAGHLVDLEGSVLSHGGSVSLSVTPGSRSDQTYGLFVGREAVLDVSGAALRTPDRTDGLLTGQVLSGGSISLTTGSSANGAVPGQIVVQEGARLDARGTVAALDVTERSGTTAATTRQQVASSGGSISFSASGDMALEGTLALQGGSSTVAGGSLRITQTGGRAAGLDSGSPNDPRQLVLAAQTTHDTAALSVADLKTSGQLDGRTVLSAERIAASGLGDLGLSTPGDLHLQGDVDLQVGRRLELTTQALTAEDGSQSRLGAASIGFNRGALATTVGTDTLGQHFTPSAGTARLSLEASAGLSLGGRVSTGGLEALTLKAGDAIELRNGALATAGALTLDAPQVFTATDARYAIEATGQTVRFQGGQADRATPLTAGGRLSVNAARIEQAGVLRAPGGQITLQASESLRLGEGSQTSVSAAAGQVLYGSVLSAAGKWLQLDAASAGSGSSLSSGPEKVLTLSSPEVLAETGATLSAEGAGSLVGTEFVAGKGGSSNLLAGGDGAYALLPSVQGMATGGLALEATAAAAGRQIVIAQTLTLGDGSVLKAGRYTLLPAAYAVLDGAFLVRPTSVSQRLAEGATLARTDGSVTLGARLADAGTGYSDALPGAWQVMSRAIALKYSEVRSTSLASYLQAKADKAGVTVGALPQDGGRIVLEAGRADLRGRIALNAGSEAGARAGALNIVAEQIQVDSRLPADSDDGVLHLAASQLNQVQGGQLVLGGVTGLDAEGHQTLQTRARSVVFAQGQGTDALSVADLLASASESLQVQDGAGFAPQASARTGQVQDIAVQGSGAALRVASASGATLSRQGAVADTASLVVGQGVRFEAGSGSLTLDSTGSSRLQPGSTLAAGEIALAAGTIDIGRAALGSGKLGLSPVALTQLAQVDRLTLRAYEQIEFETGAQLGSSDTARLVLDTPRLQLSGAEGTVSVQAQDLSLQNSSGSSGGVRTGGTATLNLQAGQQLHLGEGAVAVAGVQQLGLQAGQALSLDGSGRLVTAGDMLVTTPVVQSGLAGAAYQLQSAAALSLEGGTATSAAASTSTSTSTSALGSSLSLAAERIALDSRVSLPSGQLTATAAQDLTLGAQARLDLAGRVISAGDQQVASGGGTVSLSSSAGDLSLAGGSRIDVSGGGGLGNGGALNLSATAGSLTLAGTLIGRAGAEAQGASLSLDAATLPMLRVPQALASGSFSGEIALRQRAGDMTLVAGDTLASKSLVLSADQGNLVVAGTLDARGEEGGRIELAAAGNVRLQPGAQLLASATGDTGRGGRVSLSSVAGRVQATADSLIDLRAGAASTGAEQDGGRLTLRAAQEAGQEVAIDRLSGQVLGASRIDVQAVKVYEGISTVVSGGGSSGSRLDTATVASDASAFIGLQGEGAQGIALRLAAGQPDLRELVKVHAEAEVRASGDLAVLADQDWVLPTDAADVKARRGNAKYVGDTSVTLRAAGKLTLGRGINSGLDQTLLAGNPVSAVGGSVQIVAGADLAAARQTGLQAVPADARQGQLLIDPDQARSGLNSFSYIGSSTGDVALAAAGNISMTRGNTMVLSAGAPRSVDDEAAYQRFSAGGFYADSAFQQGGGTVSLTAGRSIIARDGSPALGMGEVGAGGHVIGGSLQAEGGASLAWGGSATQGSLSNYAASVGSFGGGAIDVRAGQDISNLVVVAPSSGYHLDATDNAGVAVDRRFAGGSVQVQAGRDIQSGSYESGGAALVLRAGRSITGNADGSEPQSSATRVYFQDTAVQVEARQSASLSRVADAQLVTANAINGLSGGASAQVIADVGDLNLGGGVATADATAVNVFASRTQLAALHGDLNLSGQLMQLPVSDGSLRMMAGASLTSSALLDVGATQTAAGGPVWVGNPDVNLLPSLTDGSSLTDQSSRSAVSLVAREGDLLLSERVDSARTLRLEAGRDVLVRAQLNAQLQPDAATGAANEQLLVKAGRDIVFNNLGVLRAAGPGEVSLLAGRDIDLGSANATTGSGLMAIGNQQNALLPKTSAQLTLVASLAADGQDYLQAVTQGFAVLGSSALSARAGDLYALLSDSSSTVLGSATASRFNSASTAEKLTMVRALLGSTATDQALAAYVRTVQRNDSLSDAQALAAWVGLSAAQRDAAPARLLAARLGTLDAARRSGFLTQVALADTPRYAQGLQAWLKLRTGRSLALAEAIAVFEALPRERQIGWLNQVLVEELRTAGRAAASSSGYEQQAAYLRGTLAIETVFAGERASGDIRLPSSQAKTLQDAGVTLVPATGQAQALKLSGITLMSPGGTVNAGESGSSGQSANNLGVVTVAGGGISAVTDGDFLVNQSRVFTLGSGDVLIWSSTGDIDAGRGAKTVSAVPPPVLRLDSLGNLYLDTSGSISGSGIAVAGKDSDLDLYAPSGAIDAGEAGIKTQGNVFLGAVTVRGADNIQVGGTAAGVSLSAAPVSLPAVASPGTNDANKAGGGDDEDERRKRRRARRNLLLDFLGFGRG